MNDVPSAAEILVVDDTPANLDLLSKMLKAHGYKVRPVPSGRLALKAAGAAPPDLILLDINMPEMNGYEVCAELKANPELRDIPVIFISALQETPDKVKAFSSGGVDYVTKPFQFDEIEARVRAHLYLRRLQEELEVKNQRLQEALDELKKLEELRNSLTHMVIHDMRSPLTAILGYLELALREEGALSANQQKWLRSALESSRGLTEMTNTLLDVSRLEEGEMPVSRSECDLRALAIEAVESMRLLAEQKKVTVSITEEAVLAWCDHALLRRVFVNLVHNAIKYTPRGGSIQINLEGDRVGARVSVSDSGCGIPPEFHARIFEKFGQVEARRLGQEHASGLGLAFCKLAVEAHGGRIGVDSAPGRGSRFSFSLPYDTTR